MSALMVVALGRSPHMSNERRFLMSDDDEFVDAAFEQLRQIYPTEVGERTLGQSGPRLRLGPLHDRNVPPAAKEARGEEAIAGYDPRSIEHLPRSPRPTIRISL